MMMSIIKNKKKKENKENRENKENKENDKLNLMMTYKRKDKNIIKNLFVFLLFNKNY